jgi:tetratricopeptide (TPR) repeat protein
MLEEAFNTVKSNPANENCFLHRNASGNIGSGLILLVFLILSGFSIAHAQWLNDPVIDKCIQFGIDKIYNFEFNKADSVFDDVINRQPAQPIGYFFRAMIQWERIISNFDDESQDDKLYQMLDVVIEMCEERLDEDPDDVMAMFFKGGSIGFRGRLRSNRGNWLGAANDGVVALPLVRRAYELEPDNYDVLLGIGIYNYYAAVIPDKYPIVKPVMIFFPSGDRKKGLEQLHQASLHAKYAKVEATYFLMQNYFTYEKEYAKALELAQKLHAKYPNNSSFHRYVGRCFISMGYLGEANEIFTDIAKRYSQKQIGYDTYDIREAYYYIGRFEFLAGRFDSALNSLYRCDEFSRKLDKDGPSGFMSLTNLLIGMIYDAQGKRQYAIQQYNKVLAMKEYENSHRDAKQYLAQSYKHN